MLSFETKKKTIKYCNFTCNKITVNATYSYDTEARPFVMKFLILDGVNY